MGEDMIRGIVREEIQAMIDDGSLELIIRGMVIDTLVGAGLEEYLQVKTGILKTN